jgi:hypothetical protein
VATSLEEGRRLQEWIDARVAAGETKYLRAALATYTSMDSLPPDLSPDTIDPVVQPRPFTGVLPHSRTALEALRHEAEAVRDLIWDFVSRLRAWREHYLVGIWDESERIRRKPVVKALRRQITDSVAGCTAVRLDGMLEVLGWKPDFVAEFRQQVEELARSVGSDSPDGHIKVWAISTVIEEYVYGPIAGLHTAVVDSLSTTAVQASQSGPCRLEVRIDEVLGRAVIVVGAEKERVYQVKVPVARYLAEVHAASGKPVSAQVVNKKYDMKLRTHRVRPLIPAELTSVFPISHAGCRFDTDGLAKVCQKLALD